MNCRGCTQERHLNDPNADLSAAQPSVGHHTCKTKGPRNRKELLSAITRAAHRLHFSYSSTLPGGDVSSEDELKESSVSTFGHECRGIRIVSYPSRCICGKFGIFWSGLFEVVFCSDACYERHKVTSVTKG